MRKFLIYALTLAVLPMSVFADDSFLDPQETAMLKPDSKVAGLYYAQDSKDKDISADEMTEINKDLHGALVDALGKHFDIVMKPGSDTMLMNVAVTNIKLKHKKRGLLGYTPIGLVATTAGNIAGKRLVIGHASLQGEFVDGVSGDKLAIFQVDQVKNLDDKKQLSWKDVQLTLQDMADKAVQARFGD